MRLVRLSSLLLLTLGALALPVDGTAQVSLGLSAGAGFATFAGDDFREPLDSEFLDSIQTKTGLVGGAYLAFPLGGLISIAPGVYYVQKGIKTFSDEPDLNGDTLKAKVSLDYIEVPLLAVFNLTGARRVGVSLFLGPTVAFELSCEFGVEQGLFVSYGDCSVDEEGLEGERKKVDFGAIFGAGLSFPLGGPVDFTVNGGLDMGLKSLRDSRFSDAMSLYVETRENAFKNSLWFLSGGVRFPLGG